MIWRKYEKFTLLEALKIHSPKLSFLLLKIHWRLSMLLRTSSKTVWSNVLWYVTVCIFWKCIQYTIHWEKTKILKNFPLDKISGTKNALYFLWEAPTCYSFTFNLQFLYGLKHKVRLYKTFCMIFYFPFHFLFIKVYIFVQQDAESISLTLKCHNSFQNENNRKATHNFALRPLIFKLNEKF